MRVDFLNNLIGGRMRIYLVVLMSLVMLGCAHKREVRGNRIHSEACQSLGFTVGSEDWAGCTAQLERARVARAKTVEMNTADGRVMSCDLTKRPSVCE